MPLLIAISLIGHHGLTQPSAPRSPLSTITRIAPAPLVGRASEVIEAGSYTYMGIKVEGSSELEWAVVMGRGGGLDQPVELTCWGSAQRFTSARLHRTFARLCFATMRSLQDEDYHAPQDHRAAQRHLPELRLRRR